MNYKDFLKEYNEAEDKNKADILRKHLTTEYLPFETKLTEGKEIARRAMSANDGRVIRNTPMLFYLFAIRSIALYTDIECDNDDVLDMFNEFNKSGIFDLFFMQIVPQREYSEFHNYVLQCSDDYYENNMGTSQYLDRKLAAYSMVLNETLNSLTEYVKSQATE